MKPFTLGAVMIAALLTGCAASPELVSCLQPNRRVAVEVTGSKNKPPAKPGAATWFATRNGQLCWPPGSPA